MPVPPFGLPRPTRKKPILTINCGGLLYSTLCRLFGEAAKKVDASVKDSLPDIPWAQIIGCRNVIAHDYDEIEDPLVWRIVADHLPALIDRLEGFFKAKGIVV
jgi:uncharacterized protein with HEPN domain